MFDKTGPHQTNQEQHSTKNGEERKQGEKMRESLREIGVNSYNYETEQYRIEEKS